MRGFIAEVDKITTHLGAPHMAYSCETMLKVLGPHAATNWSGAAVQGEPAGVNHNSNGACIYRLPGHDVQRVILPLQHHLKADIC